MSDSKSGSVEYELQISVQGATISRHYRLIIDRWDRDILLNFPTIEYAERALIIPMMISTLIPSF